jgi:hypothetical protein
MHMCDESSNITAINIYGRAHQPIGHFILYISSFRELQSRIMSYYTVHLYIKQLDNIYKHSRKSYTGREMFPLRNIISYFEWISH